MRVCWRHVTAAPEEPTVRFAVPTSQAACAIGASESIEVAIASPVATAATFATAFVVIEFITIVNDFKRT
jgi:hypothetical protein